MKPIATLLLAASTAPAQAPFGSPACPGEPADRRFFFLCHSPSQKVPLWVGYTLTATQLDGPARRPSHFRPDRELAGPGATDGDYRHSSFSRGHLAPAADFAWSETALRTTFLLSNAVPQKLSVNSGRWAAAETAVRRIARQADCVYVFTGTLFEGEPEAIGAGQVAVPSHTYKVLLAVRGAGRRTYAPIVPNQDGVRGSVNRFAVTVDEKEYESELPKSRT
jgi:endonuclease G